MDNLEKYFGYHYEFSMSNDYITIYRRNSTDVTSKNVNKKIDNIFTKIQNMLVRENFSQEVLEKAFLTIGYYHGSIKIYDNITIDPSANIITYNFPNPEQPSITLPEDLTTMGLQLLKNHGDQDEEFLALLNFIESLCQNPDKDIINRLYGFVYANNMRINPSGTITCFKKIRKDFTDLWSGKISNAVDTVVKMERSTVDSDGTHSVSLGLHVCARNYLKHYNVLNLGTRTISILVDPKNVVSVPVNFNAPLRVCEYYIPIGVQNKI